MNFLIFGGVLRWPAWEYGQLRSMASLGVDYIIAARDVPSYYIIRIRLIVLLLEEF